MSRSDFRADLLALRDGVLTFDAFAAAHATRFRKWAAHYFNRWPQTVLDLEDLAQEGMIEAWRAVDAWDPEKTADVVRFVDYQVGRKIRVELERVLGWPDKRRGKRAVRPLSIQRASEDSSQRRNPLLAEIERALDIGESRNAEELAIIADAAAAAPDALTADVITAVGLGMSSTTIADRIFEDAERRQRYGFDSYRETVLAVKRAARREAKRLTSPPGKTPTRA